MKYFRCDRADCGYIAAGSQPDKCPDCGGTGFTEIEERDLSGYDWSLVGTQMLRDGNE